MSVDIGKLKVLNELKMISDKTRSLMEFWRKEAMGMFSVIVLSVPVWTSDRSSSAEPTHGSRSNLEGGLYGVYATSKPLYP